MREGKWGGVCESLWACFFFFSPFMGCWPWNRELYVGQRYFGLAWGKGESRHAPGQGCSSRVVFTLPLIPGAGFRRFHVSLLWDICVAALNSLPTYLPTDQILCANHEL